MKKSVIAVIVIVILIAAGGYLALRNNANAPAGESYEGERLDQTEQSANPTPLPDGQTATTNNTSTPDSVPAQGTPDGGADIQVTEIDYDGSKFTPSSVNIKVNDYVVFKNNGSQDFWPASGPHPTHTAYPEFDAKKNIAPGGKYTFQFTKVGNWKFHDHLNPTAFGVVNVTQ